MEVREEGEYASEDQLKSPTPSVLVPKSPKFEEVILPEQS